MSLLEMLRYQRVFPKNTMALGWRPTFGFDLNITTVAAMPISNNGDWMDVDHPTPLVRLYHCCFVFIRSQSNNLHNY